MDLTLTWSIFSSVVLQGNGFSFSWTQLQINVSPDHKLYSSGNCPLVILQNFYPNAWCTCMNKLLLMKCLTTNTLPNWTVLHLALHSRMSWTYTLKPPLVSPTAVISTHCCQFKTISFLWTTLDILHPQISVGKYSGSTKICSIFINSTIYQENLSTICRYLRKRLTSHSHSQLYSHSVDLFGWHSLPFHF